MLYYYQPVDKPATYQVQPAEQVKPSVYGGAGTPTATSNGANVKVSYDTSAFDSEDVQDAFSAKMQLKTLDVVD